MSLFLIGCLMSCSTPQNTSKPQVKKTISTQQLVSTLSAEKLISNANKSDAINANLLLIKASEQYLIEGNPQKALWLSENLLTLKQTIEHQYQLNIVAAQASLQLNEIQRSEVLLNTSEQLSLTYNIPNTSQFYLTAHTINLKNKENVNALNNYLYAFSLNENTNIDDVNYIWENISHLSQWQQIQLANLNAPFVSGWVELAVLANKFGDNSDLNNALNNALNNWQENYRIHPANAILARISQPLETSLALNNIAVILPLSGQQAVVGKSAQEGILAAYAEKNKTLFTKNMKLTFIDSNKIDFSTLPEKLLAIEAQYVIGPLLKRNVTTYLANIELTLPTLLLNVADDIILQPYQTALSMRPEDEAIQAATLLSQKNFKHPIILSHQNNISLRTANAFAEQWKVLTGDTLAIQPFEQGSEMQKMIKQVLAIDKSQARIKNLRVKLRETLKIETRNRRDIDMIYIVATPNQTRLLKPYIDVNISPFAKRIPVFASSRSHSIKNNQSTLSDLRGLTFTQIPLLLESKQQNKILAKTNTRLWPKRNDNLQPVFAMGYDSFNLLSDLPKMKQKPYLSHFGQTGTLVLNKENILTRSLTWGSYQKDKVTEIVWE